MMSPLQDATARFVTIDLRNLGERLFRRPMALKLLLSPKPCAHRQCHHSGSFVLLRCRDKVYRRKGFVAIGKVRRGLGGDAIPSPR